MNGNGEDEISIRGLRCSPTNSLQDRPLGRVWKYSNIKHWWMICRHILALKNRPSICAPRWQGVSDQTLQIKKTVDAAHRKYPLAIVFPQDDSQNAESIFILCDLPPPGHFSWSPTDPTVDSVLEKKILSNLSAYCARISRSVATLWMTRGLVSASRT